MHNLVFPFFVSDVRNASAATMSVRHLRHRGEISVSVWPDGTLAINNGNRARIRGGPAFGRGTRDGPRLIHDESRHGHGASLAGRLCGRARARENRSRNSRSGKGQ